MKHAFFDTDAAFKVIAPNKYKAQQRFYDLKK